MWRRVHFFERAFLSAFAVQFNQFVLRELSLIVVFLCVPSHIVDQIKQKVHDILAVTMVRRWLVLVVLP